MIEDQANRTRATVLGLEECLTIREVSWRRAARLEVSATQPREPQRLAKVVTRRPAIRSKPSRESKASSWFGSCKS